MQREQQCELVPLIDYETDDDIEYSDTEFYCETCGEYVDGPCEG